MTRYRWLLVLAVSLFCAASFAQTIQPVIVEYQQAGEGKFELTNDTLSPMAVVLEPKSFRIAPDGTAMFYALDPAIHLQLSAMSVRLEPRQSYYIFYKAHADALPAWFTIYAIFSPVRRTPGVNVRVMLPHTVYLYQKNALQKDAISVKRAVYLTDKHVVICDIENQGPALGRARGGAVEAGKESVDVSGFPLLPGNPRHLEIAWTGKKPPEFLILHFDRFQIKQPLTSQPGQELNP